MRKLLLILLSTRLVDVALANDVSAFIKNGNLIKQNTTNAIEKEILARVVKIYNTSGYICSGSITNDNNGNQIIITAAHCALDMQNLKKEANTTIANNDNVVNPTDLLVYTHYTNSAKTAQVYRVKGVYVNPNAFYGVSLTGDGMLGIEDVTQINDVAILTLNKRISDVPTTYLSTSAPTSSTGVYIAGYGANDGDIGAGTSATGFGTADLLRYAKVETASINGNALDVGKKISAGSNKTYWSTTCQGDSGGPTFNINNGVVTQVGVTSFGAANANGCPNVGEMSSVMDVSQFNIWLQGSYLNSKLSK